MSTQSPTSNRLHRVCGFSHGVETEENCSRSAGAPTARNNSPMAGAAKWLPPYISSRISFIIAGEAGRAWFCRASTRGLDGMSPSPRPGSISCLGNQLDAWRAAGLNVWPRIARCDLVVWSGSRYPSVIKYSSPSSLDSSIAISYVRRPLSLFSLISPPSLFLREDCA